MHKLRSVEIYGFRGSTAPISFRLNEEANFLIGRNGTGKTTLINMVHAALAADVMSLRAASFETIILKFKQAGDRRIPSITIKKDRDPLSPYAIIYAVTPNTKSEPKIFRLSAPKRADNHLMPAYWLGNLTDASDSELELLKKELATIYKLTWLSLQRTPTPTSPSALAVSLGRDSDATGVDKRVGHAIEELVKYFTRLDKAVTDQTQAFQIDWFLSLATRKNMALSSVQRLDFEDEFNVLSSIFSRFGLKKEDYSQRLEQHFNVARRAIVKMNKNETAHFTEYMAMFDSLRLHSLVEQWQVLQKILKDIYAPKTQIVTILSGMLHNKIASVDRSNQIVVHSNDGKKVPLDELSSGEKQLLIFLAETLLQEQTNYIFLADEPELSMHVEWQEELVPNLLKINPNAQVLFATHSPDIVNKYQGSLIKMEDLLP